MFILLLFFKQFLLQILKALLLYEYTYNILVKTISNSDSFCFPMYYLKKDICFITENSTSEITS